MIVPTLSLESDDWKRRCFLNGFCNLHRKIFHQCNCLPARSSCCNSHCTVDDRGICIIASLWKRAHTALYVTNKQPEILQKRANTGTSSSLFWIKEQRETKEIDQKLFLHTPPANSWLKRMLCAILPGKMHCSASHDIRIVFRKEWNQQHARFRGTVLNSRALRWGSCSRLATRNISHVISRRQLFGTGVDPER